MNTRILGWAVASWFLVAPTTAAAQTRGDDEPVRKLYTDFFEAFRQGGPPSAVAALRQSGSLPAVRAQELERRLQGAPFPIGLADSYVVVDEMEIPHALRYRSLRFLTYHDSAPVAWRLRFYQRTNGVWIISSVDFEREFVEDFLRLPEIEFTTYRTLLEQLPALVKIGRERDRDR
jgi:hypothetical protein